MPENLCGTAVPAAAHSRSRNEFRTHRPGSGFWPGAWAWDKVAAVLRGDGNELLYAPTRVLGVPGCVVDEYRGVTMP
jgi:hypothetical protein